MRSRFAASLLAASATIMLSAGPLHAAGGEPPEGFDNDPRLGAQVDRICTGRSITGFDEATERSVVVSAGQDRHYLIETAGRCYALEDARSLAFDQFSLCLAAGDRLMPSSRTPSSAPDQRQASRPGQMALGPCQIEAIYEWAPVPAIDQAGASVEAQR
ncbi:MAG: DUF6491 family protein [Oceanicaulis sp.]